MIQRFKVIQAIAINRKDADPVISFLCKWSSRKEKG